MMFVDASAMVAVLLDETEGKRLTAALQSVPSASRVTNVIAVWETCVALFRNKRISMIEAEALVANFLSLAKVEVLEISPTDASIALSAFERYGRHRFPNTADRNRALNLADCFHYASATSRSMPILTTDGAFALTDLRTA